MERPRWFPDELDLAGQEHLDPAYAAGFERKSGGWAEDDVRLLLELGLDADSTLVDLGAGPGTLALLAVPHARRVVAVEPSPAMLSILRDRAAASGGLEVVNAGFLTYEHTGSPADVVYSRNALHHLPDFWKTVALARIRAIIRPGGIFWLRDVVYAFEPAETESSLEAWFAGAAADPAEGFTRADLEEHVREEHSTFSWLLEPMLERTGFEIVDKEPSSSRTFASYVCRAV